MKIILSRENHLFPEQERKDFITKTLTTPLGKTKMKISDIKSDSDSFSISINFFSSNNINASQVEMLSIMPENAIRYFSNGIGYAYLDNKDNRDISLKYNEIDAFNSYYISLNPNTIHKEHEVHMDIDFY